MKITENQENQDVIKTKERLLSAIKEAELDILNNDATGLFESQRDAYRVMTAITFASVLVSFIFLLLSFGFYFTKDSAKTYITTTNGYIEEIKPSKIR